MKTCPFCAEEIQDAAIVYKDCGRGITSHAPSFTAASPPAATIPDGAFNREHYRRAFAKFDANGGSFSANWNWGAMLFSGLWYFYRGMWAKGAIVFLLAILTGGIAVPFIWIYSGLAGDYDYYLLQQRGTQLWR